MCQLIAEHNAEEIEALHLKLLEARNAAGLTQDEVADRMGVDLDFVVKFDRYDNNPKLSDVRRYALAVGAKVSYTVTVGEIEIV